MASAIADALEEAVPIILKQIEDAEQRRRRQARERSEARQRARQAGEGGIAIHSTAWNDAFALEAFFTVLSRRLDARLETDIGSSYPASLAGC
jgi:hypothetical protein